MVLPLSAFALALWTTSRWGAGVSPDSAHYIGTARSLLSGQGLRFNGEVQTHWPPLYPILLAASGFGQDPFDTSRVLGAVLFALNTLLVGLVLSRQTRRSCAAVAAGCLLFAGSPEMLHIHTMAWSEPPFLLFFLAALLLATHYFKRPRLRTLAGCASCLALAMVTRYVGIALLPAFAFSLFRGSPGPAKDRIRRVFCFCAAALLPLCVWVAWVAHTPHSPAAPGLAFHPIPFARLHWLFNMPPLRWSPFNLRPEVFLVLFAAVAGLGGIRIQRRKKVSVQNPPGMTEFSAYYALLLTFTLTYLLFVVFSICFVDALTPLDARILSPVTTATVLLLTPLCVRLTNERFALRYRTLCVLILGTVCTFRTVETVLLAEDRRTNGYGYSGREWRRSETLAAVRQLPGSAAVTSNAPDVIGFWTRRQAKSVPFRSSPTTLRPNLNFDHDFSEVQAAIQSGNGALVWFKQVRLSYLPAQRDVEERMQSIGRTELPDGTIYTGQSVKTVPLAGKRAENRRNYSAGTVRK